MSFTEAQDAFFADFFRLYPIHATEAGQPRARPAVAGPDRCGRCRAARLVGRCPCLVRGHRRLGRDEEIDRRVLLTQIDALRFDEEELDEPAWSAIAYSYLLGAGLFGLLSREFAPLPSIVSPARPAGWRAFPACSRPHVQTSTSGRSRAADRLPHEKAIKTMPGVARPVPDCRGDGERRRRCPARRGSPAAADAASRRSTPSRHG